MAFVERVLRNKTGQKTFIYLERLSQRLRFCVDQMTVVLLVWPMEMVNSEYGRGK